MKSLDELQKQVGTLDSEFNFNWSLYVRYIHLVEEVGELGEALTVQQKDRKPGSGTSALADHVNIGEELGDVLFALLDLANHLHLNAEQSLTNTFKRYEQKLHNLQVANKK